MLQPPARLLLGPGPSPVPDSIRQAMALPVVGHLDPWFLRTMDEIADGLRAVFQTDNRMTLPLSGTGSAGMEAAFVNTVEPGDRVVVAINGLFGQRMAEVARRCGADVTTVESPWGTPVDIEGMERAIRETQPHVVAMVHAETSTGVLSPIEPIAEAAHAAGALVIVDAVTSLGGVAVAIDARLVDVCYSGTQKCLNVPPGLAPFTVSERGMDKVKRRHVPVQSWYLDLTLLGNYWGEGRVYHHTAPISMLYGLHEGLAIVQAEGLAPRFERHAQVARHLWNGLEAMGLRLQVEEAFRLNPLTTVRIPEGVDEARVRSSLLNTHGIEIGAGLGELKGQVWRIGLMGVGASTDSVRAVLTALGTELEAQGVAVPSSAEVLASIP